MNRSKLKSYAPKARRDFIRAVTDRAARFGITASQVEPAHEQGDTVVILGTPYPRSVGEQRRKLLRRIEINAFEQVMEEIAYTWFNRFAAIRFMEVNGYLDHGLRVLSHPAGKAIPEILEKAELAELPGLAKAEVLEMKLDGRSDAELYRLLLVAQCNALHKAMPFLFERIDDETELLLPDNLLHSDSVIRQLVEATDEADWRQIEIIGWLYQFYIAEKKDQVIGKVVRSEDIPAATQLFTPNWIVKYMVQNSLGAKWLATYPDSALKAKMEYYIEPAEQTAEVQAQLAEITPKSLDPEAITLMDPACGSGHILVEAYNLFREIYLERGYQTRDIPRLILEKNLYGLEICDRAAQLAGFAVLMRARRDDARILESPPKLNILAIRSSKGLDAKAIARELLREERVELVPSGDLLPETLPQPALSVTTAGVAERQEFRDLLKLFEDAKTLGSLIQVPQSLLDQLQWIKEALDRAAPTDLLRHYAREETNENLGGLMAQAELLGRRYHCVATNPPYMGSNYFCNVLKAHSKTYQGNRDLYGCFIQRNMQLSESENWFSLITIPNWMFLSSFESLRERLLTSSYIVSMSHNGRGVFGSDFGSVAFTCRNGNLPSWNGTFRRLFSEQGRVADNEDLEKRFFQSRSFTASSNDFLSVPSCPITYWATKSVLRAFQVGTPLLQIGKPSQGLATANDERFLRDWFEVSIHNIALSAENVEVSHAACAKWFPFTKGGEYRKWFGNNIFVINWENNGRDVKNFTNSVVRNEHVYLRQGITWTLISISNTAFRMVPSGYIIGHKGPIITSNSTAQIMFMLSFLNSVVGRTLLNVLSPGIGYEIGHIEKLPILSQDCGAQQSLRSITIAKHDWDSFELSWDFLTLPLLRCENHQPAITATYALLHAQRWEQTLEAQRLEEEINRIFVNAYGLQEELPVQVPLREITLTCNPLYRYGGDLTDAEREERLRADTMKELISYAVGCMMGRYSLDEPGLIYAHAGNDGFNPSRYQTFPADADGIIPVTDIEWFADDAGNRFVEFVKVAWPAETLAENLAFVAESLGGKSGETAADTIRRYLSQSFFKDHLQTYKRRPIYWLFSSGKQKAFEALVYLHRYNEGTLARLRMAYVTPLMAMLRGRIDQLDDQAKAASSTAAARKLEKSRSRLLAKQSELVEFDEKLRHYADQRITLDLDDGVKVNYAKFGDLLAEVKAVTGQKEE